MCSPGGQTDGGVVFMCVARLMGELYSCLPLHGQGGVVFRLTGELYSCFPLRGVACLPLD